MSDKHHKKAAFGPSGGGQERVTTGSEPRRTYDLRWSALDGFRVSWDTTAQAFPEDGEVIRVVEVVEPGHDEQTEAVAWILWGKQNDDTKPLGAYSNREVALVAEQAAEAHPNTDAFDDFWVTPWPLQDKPTLNFRIGMERPEWQPDPRTVAAVVKALREEGDPELAGGYFDAANFIEALLEPREPREA